MGVIWLMGINFYLGSFMSESSDSTHRSVLSKPREGLRVSSGKNLLMTGNFGKNEGAFRPNETVEPVMETVADLETPEAILERRLSAVVTNGNLEKYFAKDPNKPLVIDKISKSNYSGPVDTGAPQSYGGGQVFDEEVSVYRVSEGKYQLVTSSMNGREQQRIDLDLENPHKTVAKHVSKVGKEAKDPKKWFFDFDPDVVVGRLEHQLEPEKYLPNADKANELLEVFRVRQGGEADPFMPLYTLDPDRLRKKEKSFVSEDDGLGMLDLVVTYKKYAPQMEQVRELVSVIENTSGENAKFLTYNPLFNSLRYLTNGYDGLFQQFDRKYDATVWTLNESVVKFFGDTRVKNNMDITSIRDEHRDRAGNMMAEISKRAKDLIRNGNVTGSPTQAAFDSIVRESGDKRLLAFPVVYDMDFSKSDQEFKEQVDSEVIKVAPEHRSTWDEIKKVFGF